MAGSELNAFAGANVPLQNGRFGEMKKHGVEFLFADNTW
jgi:hypothetical protein